METKLNQFERATLAAEILMSGNHFVAFSYAAGKVHIWTSAYTYIRPEYLWVIPAWEQYVAGEIDSPPVSDFPMSQGGPERLARELSYIINPDFAARTRALESMIEDQSRFKDGVLVITMNEWQQYQHNNQWGPELS